MIHILEQINRYVPMTFEDNKRFDIHLSAKNKREEIKSATLEMNKKYLISVKDYMTKKSTPTFRFNAQWNKDIPMPCSIMTAEVLKETRGMYYMKCQNENLIWKGYVIKTAIIEWSEI